MQDANSVPLLEDANFENFTEEAYLAGNRDVARAVANGDMPSGRFHFERFGYRENRKLRFSTRIAPLRSEKMKRVRHLLRPEMEHTWEDNKVTYLTPELQKLSNISATDKVSSHSYDSSIRDLIKRKMDGIVLDCGAGCRDVYYKNVVNFEIVEYDTTDVLGVGESLPFKDNSFDAVISVAVLEHVRDPFTCAREISRILKPGGELFCSVPFLQPYHGFPHHYFNATHQGLRRLFEDNLEVIDVYVPRSTHPIKSLTWILNSWATGLAGEVREEFLSMSVKYLMTDAGKLLEEKFCTELDKEKWLELASATTLRARKQAAS